MLTLVLCVCMYACMRAPRICRERDAEVPEPCPHQFYFASYSTKTGRDRWQQLHSMYLYVCIFMYVCMCVCVCVCNRQAQMAATTQYVCTCLYVYLCVYACVCVYSKRSAADIAQKHVQMTECLSSYIHTFIHIHAYTYAYTRKYVHAYTYRDFHACSVRLEYAESEMKRYQAVVSKKGQVRLCLSLSLSLSLSLCLCMHVCMYACMCAPRICRE